MRLLNTLRMLVSPTPPNAVVGSGEMYYDSRYREPRYHNGEQWVSIGQNGFEDPILTSFLVPDGRQIMYFDAFTNNGVITILGSGSLVGVR
jgi:hypothetical protein